MTTPRSNLPPALDPNASADDQDDSVADIMDEIVRAAGDDTGGMMVVDADPENPTDAIPSPAPDFPRKISGLAASWPLFRWRQRPRKRPLSPQCLQKIAKNGPPLALAGEDCANPSCRRAAFRPRPSKAVAGDNRPKVETRRTWATSAAESGRMNRSHICRRFQRISTRLPDAFIRPPQRGGFGRLTGAASGSSPARTRPSRA